MNNWQKTMQALAGRTIREVRDYETEDTYGFTLEFIDGTHVTVALDLEESMDMRIASQNVLEVVG